MSDIEIPKDIDDREYLYRGIHEMHWRNDESRPTTSAFKNNRGASVDRDCLIRREEDCVKTLVNNLKHLPIKAVCSVTAENVRAVDAYPIYMPSKDNKFHSEIHDSAEEVVISDPKIIQLISKCKIIKLHPSLEKTFYQIEQSDSGSPETVIIAE